MFFPRRGNFPSSPICFVFGIFWMILDSYTRDTLSCAKRQVGMNHSKISTPREGHPGMCVCKNWNTNCIQQSCAPPSGITGSTYCRPSNQSRENAHLLRYLAFTEYHQTRHKLFLLGTRRSPFFFFLSPPPKIMHPRRPHIPLNSTLPHTRCRYALNQHVLYSCEQRNTPCDTYPFYSGSTQLTEKVPAKTTNRRWFVHIFMHEKSYCC